MRTLSMVKLLTLGSVFAVLTMVVVSSIAWRRFTCALTSLLLLGRWGVSWSMSILEAKAL
jgi:hypothetical protein